MKTVGYLTNTAIGLEGESGPFYDYIVAGNGLFVQAENSLLKATLHIAEATVRGLLPLEERVELIHGKIPQRFYDLALSILAANPYHEHYLAVIWEEGYSLKKPSQEGSKGGVKYNRLARTILDIHSHGTMDAFFSPTDDEDEKGLRLYMVMGRMETLFPEVKARVGVYGYFATLDVSDVFE